MLDNLLSEAVQAIAPALQLSHEEAVWALNTLKDHFSNRIAIVWTTGDVHTEAESMGVDLTEEQARDILQRVEASHDANIGLNWEQIHGAIWRATR